MLETGLGWNGMGDSRRSRTGGGEVAPSRESRRDERGGTCGGGIGGGFGEGAAARGGIDGGSDANGFCGDADTSGGEFVVRTLYQLPHNDTIPQERRSAVSHSDFSRYAPVHVVQC